MVVLVLGRFLLPFVLGIGDNLVLYLYFMQFSIYISLLETTSFKSDSCRFLIHRLNIEISFTTHFFGKIQYVGIK